MPKDAAGDGPQSLRDWIPLVYEKACERAHHLLCTGNAHGAYLKLPRFDFDLVAYGFLDRDFSEENLVIWAVDAAVEKNLGARAVEHFENRCRLLALEKGLSGERFRKWKWQWY